MRNKSGLSQGLSIAFRFGIEMAVAIGLGGLMGYSIDYFSGTRPWFFVAGVFLGGAAGVLNVYRAAQEITFEDDDGPNDQGDPTS
jgi:ATP synthase protein I